MAQPTLEDEFGIRQLYARYSWALDTGDTDGYCALFTDDAVMKLRAKTLVEPPGTTASAGLSPGKYWWQAVLTATGERVTAGEGELTMAETLKLAGFDTASIGKMREPGVVSRTVITR